MADSVITEYSNVVYKLRSGSPIPVCGDCEFVLHTFMAEVTVVDVFLCTDTLPSSSDFRGRGGDLMSASFTRLKSEGGGNLFEGTQNNKPKYIPEREIPD